MSQNSTNVWFNLDKKRVENVEIEEIEENDEEINTQDIISDNTYQITAKGIVTASIEQLESQNYTKNCLRKKLLTSFIWLLFLQLLLITVLVVLSSVNIGFSVDKSVLITIITSVFVETLGVVAIMVKFAFDSTQEVEIINILHSYISNFKIFNSSEHKHKKSNQKEEQN